tara:strand:- start:59 stop:757 length:699 start_codon:yes stop_codon:yes gene_type:complete
MLHIFTLYYGSKFTKDNVNHLYKQIKKYYKSEFTFYCYTDKKDKLVSGIKKIKLDRESNPSVREAWYKIDFFKKDFVKYSKGDMCIVMDIDQEIVNDPTPLLDMDVPENAIGSLSKWWTLEPTCELDGGFYKWHANTLTEVYDIFYRDPMKWMTKYWQEGIVTIPYFGEQNFVSDAVGLHIEAPAHLAARWKEEKSLDLNAAYYYATDGDILNADGKWSERVVLIHHSKFIG